MSLRFYGNGKLFLTGEYVVLDGAIAFAVPTKFGQSLEVSENGLNQLHWQSFDADGSLWYEASIALEDIVNNASAAHPVTQTLIGILHVAHRMNPNILHHGWYVKTQLTFPRNWGLGSSSTLIYTIAEWFGINPFHLLRDSFGGSGYDIACAGHDAPIFYKRTAEDVVVEEVDFHPSFINKLYFVYLNQKQSSKSAIAAYRSKQQHVGEVVAQIDGLTQRARQAKSSREFAQILREHEAILSEVIEQTPVQQRLFPDFDGTVKSLGAWGGDFVLVVSENDPSGYFKGKGYETIIGYRDMVL